MTARELPAARWDRMRALIEAGGHSGWPVVTYDHDYEPDAYGVCRRCGGEKHGPAGTPIPDEPIDTKQAQHDGSRQIYGDAGTFMRGGEPG